MGSNSEPSILTKRKSGTQLIVTHLRLISQHRSGAFHLTSLRPRHAGHYDDIYDLIGSASEGLSFGGTTLPQFDTIPPMAVPARQVAITRRSLEHPG
jgi:hypothetical protein